VLGESVVTVVRPDPYFHTAWPVCATTFERGNGHHDNLWTILVGSASSQSASDTDPPALTAWLHDESCVRPLHSSGKHRSTSTTRPALLALRSAPDAVARALLAESPTALAALRDSRGNHALHYAVVGGRLPLVAEVAPTLFADLLDVPNESGMTPLWLATKAGYYQGAQMLLKAGASPNVRDKGGVEAVRLAWRANDERLTHALVTSGGDISPVYEERNKLHREAEKQEAEQTQLVDEYGFIVETDDGEDGNGDRQAGDGRTRVPRRTPSAAELTRLRSRAKKWADMLASPKPLLQHPKFRSRLEKGVPDTVRPVVWARLLELDRTDDLPSLSLLDEPGTVDPAVCEQIDLDINRESRTHSFFAARYGRCQRSLFRILRAFAAYDSEVGYCQGMSSVAAMLLVHLPEGQAFHALVRLLTPGSRYAMRGLFLPGFPLLAPVVEVHESLLMKRHPAVGAALRDMSSAYLVEWMMKMFYHRFPFSLALRMWDYFLAFGFSPLVFAAAQAVFDEMAGEFSGKSASIEVILPALQRLDGSETPFAEESFMRRFVKLFNSSTIRKAAAQASLSS